MSGSDVDGYNTAMYFIVMPAVLGPISTVMFVVAVYLCRRRCYDGRPPSTVKRAPARVAVTSARSTPTVGKRSTTQVRGGVDDAVLDEETQVMLPCGTASAGVFANQLTG